MKVWILDRERFFKFILLTLGANGTTDPTKLVGLTAEQKADLSFERSPNSGASRQTYIFPQNGLLPQ
jgi:hypothetical protein